MWTSTLNWTITTGQTLTSCDRTKHSWTAAHGPRGKTVLATKEWFVSTLRIQSAVGERAFPCCTLQWNYSSVVETFSVPVWRNVALSETVSWNRKCWLIPVMKCIVSCDWPRGTCSSLLYSVFMHTGSELYVCLTTCTSLSSTRQHLVIWDLEINAVIMCGTLFLLSHCVFSTLNRFCHSVDTWLGLSHCVVHIRGGLPGLWALRQFATSEYLVRLSL